MPRRLIPVCATLALAFAGAASASDPPPPGAGAPMPLVGSAFTLLGAHTPAQALDNLAASGVRAIRQDFLWARIERTPGVYDFSVEDELVNASAARGIEVIAILAYGNPLYSRAGAAAQGAGTGGGVPPFGIGAAYLFPPDPENLPSYRAFAAATAAHFAGRVRHYEVWNEENVGWRFWPPHEDAGAYAPLLRAAGEAIRAADAVAQVSVGGVFYPEIPPGLPEEGGLRYLGHLWDADPAVGGVIDAVAWHPYPYPFVAPEVVLPGNSSVPGSAAAVRAFLGARGDPGERLWVTEVGWPTHSEYGVSEERQAAYLVRAFAGLWAEGVEMLVWYTYADGPNAEHNQEDAFGLWRFDGSAKPAARALATFTAVLAEGVLAGWRDAELGLASREHALAFSGAGEQVTILWTSPESLGSDYGPMPDTDARRTIEVPVSGSAELVSITGERTALVPSSGRVQIEISPVPLYLITT